jgi:hypothetical protein
MNRIANVCIVIGTGYIGIATHDDAAINQLPTRTTARPQKTGLSARAARKGAI